MQFSSEREYLNELGNSKSIRLFALYDVILLSSLC